MSQNFTNLFTESYSDFVKVASENRGYQLPATVRTATGIVGNEHKFAVYGKGSAAASKALHVAYSDTGLGGAKTFKNAILTKDHWFDWVADEEIRKSQIDDVMYTAKQAVIKIGQAMDKKIIDALDTTTSTAGTNVDGLTKAKVLAGLEVLNGNGVDFENRFMLVDAKQWSDLMALPEFSSADYIGSMGPWVNQQNSRFWAGMNVILYPGLPKSGTDRTCFIYQMDGVGHAIAQDLTSTVTWHDDRDSWLVKSVAMSGAVLLENESVVKLPCSEA